MSKVQQYELDPFLKNIISILIVEKNSYQKKEELSGINKILWEVEDRLRVKEVLQQFDDEFIRLARMVYETNDQRFLVKNSINRVLCSTLSEVKSYNSL